MLPWRRLCICAGASENGSNRCHATPQHNEEAACSSGSTISNCGNGMNDFLPLLGIVGALAVGVVSPGPSFLMVARTAAAGSRPDGRVSRVAA
jgi:hypothetical protein